MPWRTFVKTMSLRHGCTLDKITALSLSLNYVHTHTHACTSDNECEEQRSLAVSRSEYLPLLSLIVMFIVQAILYISVTI